MSHYRSVMYLSSIGEEGYEAREGEGRMGRRREMGEEGEEERGERENESDWEGRLKGRASF